MLIYTVILITCVIFKKWELKLFYFLLLWTIALVSVFSMRHILKLSKPLERQGIHQNHRLLGFFSLFSLLAVICFTACLIIYLIVKIQSPASAETMLRY